MILFNITFNVEDEIKDLWLDYAQQNLIPSMLKSKLLHSALFTQILINEPQGTSYALQLQSDSKKNLEKFQTEELPEILSELQNRFQDKIVFFPTKMKIIKKYR